MLNLYYFIEGGCKKLCAESPNCGMVSALQNVLGEFDCFFSESTDTSTLEDSENAVTYVNCEFLSINCLVIWNETNELTRSAPVLYKFKITKATIVRNRHCPAAFLMEIDICLQGLSEKLAAISNCN